MLFKQCQFLNSLTVKRVFFLKMIFNQPTFKLLFLPSFCLCKVWYWARCNECFALRMKNNPAVLEDWCLMLFIPKTLSLDVQNYF